MGGATLGRFPCGLNRGLSCLLVFVWQGDGVCSQTGWISLGHGMDRLALPAGVSCFFPRFSPIFRLQSWPLSQSSYPDIVSAHASVASDLTQCRREYRERRRQSGALLRRLFQDGLQFPFTRLGCGPNRFRHVNAFYCLCRVSAWVLRLVCVERGTHDLEEWDEFLILTCVVLL